MPNIIAFLALALWPLVTAALFQRLPMDRALIWGLLLGYLFLPEPPAGFDLPLLPPFNKHNIPALSALIVVMMTKGLPGSLLPQSSMGRALVLIFVLSPIITCLTNPEPVIFGRVTLPALSIKTAVALVVQQFLLLVPFLLARLLLISGEAQREVLRAYVACGLVYSVLMLLETRVSPQLNLWIYGYYQHFFGQSIRFGGYRPVVFLYHGLWVAFFCMTTVIAAFAMWRFDRIGKPAQWLGAGIYLFVVLVLAKSVGALALALLGVPLVLLLGRRMQIRAALVLAGLALTYPLLKGMGLIPEEQLVQLIGSWNADRAASLDFRFYNENVLLDRAWEKPLFGWGSWGRNMLWDPLSGEILTITDGRWIIVIGTFGWLGFLAEFGLLLWPVVLMHRKTHTQAEGDVSPFIAPLTLLLGLNMVDLLPNATLTPLTFMIAGALTGYAEQTQKPATSTDAALANISARQGLKWQSIL